MDAKEVQTNLLELPPPQIKSYVPAVLIMKNTVTYFASIIFNTIFF